MPFAKIMSVFSRISALVSVLLLTRRRRYDPVSGAIVIGPRSNIQDNAVIHLADDYGCYIGELVTVGHSAILHACTVKDEVLIGMGAIVLDGSVIGERSIIGAGALVTGGTIIPPGSLVLGSPAKVVRTLSLEEQLKIRSWADKYVRGSRIYLERK